MVLKKGAVQTEKLCFIQFIFTLLQQLNTPTLHYKV